MMKVPHTFRLQRFMAAHIAYGQACRAGADALTAWWKALYEGSDGAEELRAVRATEQARREAHDAMAVASLALYPRCAREEIAAAPPSNGACAPRLSFCVEAANAKADERGES